MAIPPVVLAAAVYGLDICVITISGSIKSIIFVEPPYNFGPRELGLMHLGPVVGTIFGALSLRCSSIRIPMYVACPTGS
ncbi:hypothetical protein J3459_011899 [Metarhizium acridum]|uniref:uncharacterized protein n=1 Tax=Metarhizium acridum TaxID=92637 RepID=UPI001C6C27CE|nr:hypothetical protein J3458_022087 [Metarhizium acridum]KAG8418919.1 hypothetical protein J3459_011899 [Metarhizium acridum]